MLPSCTPKSKVKINVKEETRQPTKTYVSNQFGSLQLTSKISEKANGKEKKEKEKTI